MFCYFLNIYYICIRLPMLHSKAYPTAAIITQITNPKSAAVIKIVVRSISGFLKTRTINLKYTRRITLNNINQYRASLPNQRANINWSMKKIESIFYKKLLEYINKCSVKLQHSLLRFQLNFKFLFHLNHDYFSKEAFTLM